MEDTSASSAAVHSLVGPFVGAFDGVLVGEFVIAIEATTGDRSLVGTMVGKGVVGRLLAGALVGEPVNAIAATIGPSVGELVDTIVGATAVGVDVGSVDKTTRLGNVDGSMDGLRVGTRKLVAGMAVREGNGRQPATSRTVCSSHPVFLTAKSTHCKYSSSIAQA